ncbi:FecR family protein [Armatimonas rosea]|uniref:FecR protein domain-containing protein n=1 Tax=Armatimonas rosea TaxID=685828 RepID=A0A7W9W7U4_ARMRO|nr:FecR family protein [Armatimonas rosea]MBB6052053.1 hypothetical protein [Armatimonas rosea]
MTRPVIVSLLALSALAASASAQGTTVGTLSIVRQVEVTRTRATPEIRANVSREIASQGESVFAEQLIHTLKRSMAEVALKNGTVLRLKDRSEVIVRADSFFVTEGTAWVRTGKNSVRVDTPSGTITATNATFEVIVKPGGVRVYCYDGSLKLSRESRTVPVKAGELSGLNVSGNVVAVETVEEIPGDQRTSDLGGPRDAWWVTVERERGLLTLPGSSAGMAIRSSALTEAIQASLNLPPRPGEIINNPADKARLLSIAQASVVPAIERTLASDTSLTLSGYRQKFGAEDLTSQYTLSGSDLSFLRTNGIASVGNLFDALNASGASFGLDLRSRPTSRSVYRPSAWQGASNVRTPFFDGAKRSNSLFFLGVAAAALLDGKSKTTDILGDAEAFGFTSDPQGIGGRGRLFGSLGKTHFQFEGNVLRLLSGSNPTSYDALSVASLDRDMGNGLTAFVGRRRFYSGPALLALNRSQLLGERYSAFGGTLNRNGVRAEAAWLYDSNPDVRGAQTGFLASAVRQVGGGTVGGQFLRVGSLSSGTGYSVSGSLPLAKGMDQIDGYAELGVAPDKAGIATVGLYFPWLYQANDLDIYLEYSSHQDLGSSTTLTASRELSGGGSLRAFVGNGRRTFLQTGNFYGGVGLSYPLTKR